MFCSSTLHFPSFASIPSTAAAAMSITFYICLDRPLPGAPVGGLPVYSTHNTTPVLVSYGCFHTPLWGLGTFAAENFPQWFSVVFCSALHRSFPCGSCVRNTSASSSVTKIPVTSTSRRRALAPAGSTTSTFRTRPPAVRLSGS